VREGVRQRVRVVARAAVAGHGIMNVNGTARGGTRA
jgi:hypothetical protein